jgi:hypothetical protein
VIRINELRSDEDEYEYEQGKDRSKGGAGHEVTVCG